MDDAYTKPKRAFDPAHELTLPLNDPMIDAALTAHWGYPGPHGVKRRKKMQAALVAAAKAARAPSDGGGE